MRSLDPDAVYTKALAHPAGVDDLDEHEVLVYAVKELETYIAMSGWEGFFTGSCSYLYPHVRRCLELTGDSRSLAILDSYVNHLASFGVAIDADAIEDFNRSWTPGPAQPAWGKQFQAAVTERWQRIRSYLESQNILLVDRTLRRV